MPNSRLGIAAASAFVGLLFVLVLIHYGIDRSDNWLFPAYGLGFCCYFILYKKSNLNFQEMLALAILLRLLLFFGSPTLSDDYHRFLWDGQVWTAGTNPYQFSPFEIKDELTAVNPELYQNLNSKDYHSTYPPLSQYLFAVPAWLGMTDLFSGLTVIRIILVGFDIGSLILLFQLSNSVSKVMLYAMNPLVLLELTGNLHFEGVVVFFVLLALWFYQKRKWLPAASALALGILAKLTPLMFLPILFRKIGIRKAALSYLLISLVLVVLSLPLLNFEVLAGMISGLDLFFRKFEFNAGLFFLLREVGFWIKGYDMVHTIGPMLTYVAFALILIYAMFGINRETKWSKAFMLVMFIQLLFATTVHPWYVIPLVAFSCLAGYVFPVLWSLLVILSYSGYSSNGYEHPMLLIFVEYSVVTAVGLYELIKKRPLLDEL